MIAAGFYYIDNNYAADRDLLMDAIVILSGRIADIEKMSVNQRIIYNKNDQTKKGGWRTTLYFSYCVLLFHRQSS